LRTVSELGIRENDKMHLDIRIYVDIGVFESQHLESEGRAWLLKTKSDPTQQEVSKMIEGLGGSQMAKVLVLMPIKDLKCDLVRRYAEEKYQKGLEAGETDLSDFKIELSPSKLEALIGQGPFRELQAIFGSP
jgi:hypothetical protein